MFVCGNTDIDVRNIPLDYNWIAQDLDGKIWIYENKPVRRNTSWDIDQSLGSQMVNRIQEDFDLNEFWYSSLVKIPRLKNALERILNDDAN